MFLQQFFIEGLGCASYLVGCEGAGVAAVIDPDREVDKYLAAAQGRGLKITHIIETHLHADHVSGNQDLAALTGAEIYVHAAGRAEFPHQPIQAGDVITLGNIRLQVRHTPGHTPESITLLVSDTTRAAEPWLAFTGDTLFVGDVGRPDLVGAPGQAGAEAARGLARELHHSLFNDLLALDDAVLIYPGHGAGSLCGKAIGAMRATTLGYERRHNPALLPRPVDAFVDFATEALPEQPGNHTRIKALNRRGPRPMGTVSPRPLTIEAALPYFQGGAALLDTRPKAAFVKAHIPGSVHLEADDQLSNRVGFVLPPDVPLVVLLSDPNEYAAAVYALARVGYDTVVGYLADDLERWRALGLPLTSGDVQDLEPAELARLLAGAAPPVVVDVREPWEFAQGHVPGARLIPLGQLQARLGELDPATPVAVICASGSRSQSAAALLGQRNFTRVYNILGGTGRWRMAGLPLEK